MPADRRLFDSSSLVTPPAPEIDAMANNMDEDDGFVDFDHATEEHIKKAKAAAERAGWRQHGFRYTHPTHGSYLVKDMDGWYDLCGNEGIEWWRHATDVVPEIPGVDPGYALLTLEGRGLCWTDEPDIVGSTPAGLKAATENA